MVLGLNKMLLEEIVLILQNKIRSLQTAKNAASQNGNLESYNQIDVEIITTQASLDKILTL
jgi:hypothetical protein